MNYGYVRSATNERAIKKQIEVLKKYHIDKWYTEIASGAVLDGRAQLQAMLAEIKEGDTVYVADFSRLARNTEILIALLKEFEQREANIVSDKDGLEKSSDIQKTLVAGIEEVNEFERLIKKRV